MSKDSEIASDRYKMKNNWDESTVVDAWVKASSQYGDAWRMALVNPIIDHLVEKISGQLHAKKYTPDSLKSDSLYVGLCNQLKSKKDGSLEDWHKAKIKQKLASPLTVLDIGCGEAYLSRFLCPRGADYIGIDSSKKLLENAKNGDKKGKNTADYHQLDIDNIALPQKENVRVALGDIAAKKIHLAVAVAILEHIEEPVPFLQWLSRALVNEMQGSGVALFITLNPDYFSSFPVCPGSSAKIVGAEKSVHVTARIDSAAVDVEIVLRSQHLIKRLFRDGRFRIIQHARLNFQQPTNIGAVSHPGVPPFEAYLVTPYPQGNYLKPDNDICDYLEKNVAAYSFLSKDEKKVFRANLDKYERITVKPREILMEPHNLGGDLYFILKGGLVLQDGDKILSLFREGELIGDLEFGEPGKEYDYIYSVAGSEQASEVVRIPAVQARELLKDNSFAKSIFVQLRDRVIVRNCSTLGFEKEYETGEKVPGILYGKKDTSRVSRDKFAALCRMLLAASEKEQQLNKRSFEGRQVLIAPSEDDPDTSKALRFLTMMGYIDCLPGKELKRKNESKFIDVVHYIVQASLTSIIGHGKQPTPAMELIKDNIKAKIDLSRDLSRNRKWTQKMTEVLQTLSQYGSGIELPDANGNKVRIDLPENWKGVVEHWSRYLWTAYYSWNNGSPGFIILNDITMLHNIILLDKDKLDNLIGNKFESLYRGQFKENLPDWSEIASMLVSSQHGRLDHYIDEIKSFLENDLLNNDGRLNLSNSLTGHEAPTVN